MKKLRQYLLVNYPVIWNTRIYIILPILLVVHFLALLLGLSRDFSYESIFYRDIEPDFGIGMFSVMVALSILIIWLVFYLRNNALKSLYPANSLKLMIEFCCILLITVGSVSITTSYRIGSILQFTSVFNKTDVVKEANIVNLASSFLPFDFNLFSKGNSCEGTVPRPANPDEDVVETAALDRYRVTDTLPDSAKADISFLNYCNQRISVEGIKTSGLLSATELHAITTRWLRAGRKDSVKDAINQFLAIAKKYDDDYVLNVDNWVNEIFSTTDFRVKRKLATGRFGGRVQEYVSMDRTSNGIYNINRFRDANFFNDETMILLWFGFCLGTIMLSFRLTKTRVWFIALIGSIIWAILFGLLGGTVLRHSGLPIFYLALTAAFFIYTAVSIGARKGKTNAGVSFVWALWALPFFIPVCFAAISMISSYSHDYEYQRSGIATWIDEHWVLIWNTNLVSVVLMIAFVMLPMARKWQAMPDE